MKILNLYAGIGENRKLWGDEHQITAVEYNAEIAAIYKDFFPHDNLIICDAHEYLLKNFAEFDFIWASPPCPTHSRLRLMNKNIVYPDMTLWQEIIFLKHWFKGKYIVENVIPYYEPLIKPNSILHRHYFWSNFFIDKIDQEKLNTCKKYDERNFLSEKLGFNLDKFSGIDKRKVLRNCVVPEIGKHIFDCMLNQQINQGVLF